MRVAWQLQPLGQYLLLLFLFPDCLFVDRIRDEWVVSPACHQVVVFGKQKRWEKYSRTLPLWCRCDIQMHTGQNQTVDACQLLASRYCPGLRSVGSGSTARPLPLFKVWPCHVELRSQEGTDRMNVCICASSCACVCEVVSQRWNLLFKKKKKAQKRQNPVFSDLRSQLVHTFRWNWQLKFGSTLPTQRQTNETW